MNITNLTNIEIIQDKILNNGIKLLKSNNITLSIAAIKINDKKGIVYDLNKFDNPTDEYTALSHEYYHCEVDAFYNFKDSLQTRKRREYKANKQLVLDLIPIDALKKLLQTDFHKWEIAEEFGVTEDTIDLAFKIYKNMGEL